MKKFFLFWLPGLLLMSCTGMREYKRLTTVQQVMADSLLSYGLDHEALYSLADTLKPVSSLQFFSLSAATGTDSLQNWQNICKRLSNSKVQLVIVPYRQADSTKRNYQIYAVNLSKLRSKITEQSAFFYALGLNVHSSAEQVLTVVEYSPAMERWRGYGYLFGYPDDAVDFFVAAGAEQQVTGKFVERDFFAIPVHAANKGYFTYAIPKNTPPRATDSLLYKKAMQTLVRYRQHRPANMKEKEAASYKLWKKLSKRNKQ